MCPLPDSNAPKRPNPPPFRPLSSPEVSPSAAKPAAKPVTPKIVALKRSEVASGGEAALKSAPPPLDRSERPAEQRSPASQKPTSSASHAFPPVVPPDPSRPHPIPPASEPMQYRAIGLVRGRYQPSAEQFTKGDIVAADGSTLDAVLLGRVLSLIKNHVDLNADHLWVVYPRTREEGLHVQVVGLWEPETLHQEGKGAIDAASTTDDPDDDLGDDSDDDPEGSTEGSSGDDAGEATPEDPAAPDPTAPVAADEATDDKLADLKLADRPDQEPTTPDPATPNSVSQDPAADPGDSSPPSALDPGDLLPSSTEIEEEFSIRGEVIFSAPEQEQVLVKIKQAPRTPKDKRKAFKLQLKGNLGDRAVGRFWEFVVKREATTLAITAATSVALIPPKKRKGGGKPGDKPGGRPGGRPGGKSGLKQPFASEDGKPLEKEFNDRPRTSVDRPSRPQKKASPELP